MSNQFNIDNLNSFLDSASKAISCDSECQHSKEAETLENEYLTAQSNLTLAKPNYELAKQNYYTYIDGQSGYNEMIEQELTTAANLFVQKFKENYYTEKSKIHTQLEIYNGLSINLKNILDLYEKYKKDNIKLAKEVKDGANDILTNERKTYYEEQQNDSLNIYYYYFLLVIYYIIVICFIIFSIIYHSTINLKIRLFLGLIFIILPLISSWILGMIIKLVYWLFSLLPKNVYK